MTFFKKCVCGLLSFSSISLWLPEPFVLPAAWTTSHWTNGNCIDGQTTLALWHCGRGWGSWSAIAHQPKLFVVRCIHTPYMKHDNIKLFIRWLVDVKRVFFFLFYFLHIVQSSAIIFYVDNATHFCQLINEISGTDFTSTPPWCHLRIRKYSVSKQRNNNKSLKLVYAIFR